VRLSSTCTSLSCACRARAPHSRAPVEHVHLTLVRRQDQKKTRPGRKTTTTTTTTTKDQKTRRSPKLRRLSRAPPRTPPPLTPRSASTRAFSHERLAARPPCFAYRPSPLLVRHPLASHSLRSAPSGRAFSLSANRDRRLASCPSTSQRGRSHRPTSRTLSAFRQAAFLRPPALLSRAGTRREIAPRLCRASIPSRGDRVHTARWLWWCCSELEGCCVEDDGRACSLMGALLRCGWRGGVRWRRCCDVMGE